MKKPVIEAKVNKIFKEKIRQNAFTLVELLAVITILGVIALIAFPSVDRIIKNSKIKVYEKQKDALLSSLEDWKTDNENLFFENNNITLTLGDLKEQNYVDYDIKNPKTDKCISNDLTLTVSKTGKKYTYSIEGDELVDGLDDDCDVTKRFPSIYLVGASVMNLEINTDYVEPGYSAKDLDDNKITSNVEVTNNIDKTKLGSYNVTYEVTIGGLTKTKIRKVNVVDTIKPVISIIGSDTINSEIDVFNFMTGVTITDNSGETIIPKIKSNLSIGINGIYEVLYIATDSSGNTNSRKRVITIDTVDPTVKVSVRMKKATITLEDNLGVVGYSVTNSTSKPSSWTDITSIKKYTVEYTASEAGIYYVHVKDAGGRTSYKEFEILATQYALESGTYTTGSTITWANKSWKVLKDNGTSVTLILAGNYGTGIYGSTTSYATSTAKTVVNTNFVNENSIMGLAIEEESLIYDSTTASYVRLPYDTELSTSISNTSNTPFWTMSATGSNLYLGSKTGAKANNYVSETTGTYYSGYATAIATITKSGMKTYKQQAVAQSPSSSTVSITDSVASVSRATTYGAQSNITHANASGYGCSGNVSCPNSYCGALTGQYYGDTCSSTGTFTYYGVQSWWNANYNVWVGGRSCGSNVIYFANGPCQTFYTLSATSSSIGYRPVVNVLKK